MRIIGALLILCSAFFIANRMIFEVEKAFLATSALRSVMEHTKNLIECYSLPIGQILKRLDPTILEACGYKNELGNPPCTLIELAQNSCVPDEESLDIFLDFAKDFGKEYRKDELLRCSAFLERMRSREQKLSKESAKKKKVILTVSLCIALAIVILLI